MYLKKQVKRNLLLFPFTLVLPVFLILSCDSTDSGSEEERFQDGISLEIRELLGDELLNIIENELEMPIHRGDNPPDIAAVLSAAETMRFQKDETSISTTAEVTVLMTPYLLLKTNVPDDEGVREPGSRFTDLYLRFSHQDIENYTIDFDNIQPGFGPTFGPGSFIIGNGNKFTIVGPSREVVGEETVLTVEIFSGTITNAEGISSPHHALVMVDNAGVSDFIPNNTGRSFEDEDGFAPLNSWPEGEEQTSSGALENNALGQVRLSNN